MRKYYIEEDNEIYEDVEEVIGACIEEDYHRDDDYFEEWVNNRYDSVEIYGETYYPYDILVEMGQGDLDSLRDEYCELENDNDWENVRYELEHYRVGTQVYIHNKTVKIIEDEEDSGNVETIEDVRERLKENKAFEIEQAILNEKEEKDLMNMFQIVGE